MPLSVRLLARALLLSPAVLAALAPAASCGGGGGGGGAPTDNPVATLYGAAAYPWADEVRWSCVWSVADFAGAPDEAFAAAQAAAVAGGGGVVFFPAGTYAFASNISLASGVVIRGAPTAARARGAGAAPGPLAPTTVFECPNKKHQGIWNFAPDAANLGVVNVLLDQCAVMLWPSLVTSSFSPMMSAWWFAASDIAGMGRNKIVLSNVVRDVSLGQSLLAPKPLDVENVYPYAFSIAVGVYAERNALVANNLMPASLRDEQTTITVGGVKETVPYAYDNRYGIDVNSILLGAVAGSYCKGPGSKCGTPSAFGGLSPSCAPWNFAEGLVIRDNFVAQNGRVGISWSGGAGAALCSPGNGTLVLNNHVEVRSNTTCWTVDGHSAPRGSDTNENRGFMLSGYCSNATGNSAHVNRQRIPGTSYETVDGEGILHQSENGNWAYGDVVVGNDMRGGESGYIAAWDLQWANETTMVGNSVNPDQFIGVVLMNNDVIGPGWRCEGNSPPAVFKSGAKSVPCPSAAP